MRLIEVNSFIPYIQQAPHKIYIIEFEMAELPGFKVNPKEALKKFAAFANVDDRTNISVDGIDGDKGVYNHSNVKATHGVIMDFRPLMIKVIYWDKPGASAAVKALTDILPSGPIQTITQ